MSCPHGDIEEVCDHCIALNASYEEGFKAGRKESALAATGKQQVGEPEIEFQSRLMDVKTDLPTENWRHSPTYEENPGRGTRYWVQYRKRYIYYTPPAQGLSPIATRKLEELAAQGYVTNGVAIFNPATGKRGLVDNLGYVGWQGEQGIDLGQFRKAVEDYTFRTFQGSEDRAYGDRLLALIDGRDAGAGVGS